MKSPAELKAVLKRQWENRTLREARLLGAATSWPLTMTIGRPSPALLQTDLDAVKRHVDAWRRVTNGDVLWEEVSYRAAAECVRIPVGWRLNRPSEWIAACDDNSMWHEFESMATLVKQTESIFHSLFVRQRSLWRGKPLDEVVQAARLALALKPGLAAGKPLRTLSIEGIDTKFFERHERLVTTLLDLRFDGEVSAIGLEAFLGAFAEGDHWLLVIDLDGSLLPFQKQRVRGSELRVATLPGTRLLVVENECCQHHLPRIRETIAVLGAGFDLDWLFGFRTSRKQVAYWGDIDTWGLQFLSKARQAIEQIDALMMTEEVYLRFADSAVREPVVANHEPPGSLNQAEQSLYRLLVGETHGRLEQEFLPEEFVRQTIISWAN